EARDPPPSGPAPTGPNPLPRRPPPPLGGEPFAQGTKARSTLPTPLIAQTRTARAGRALVPFYHHGALIKVHPRQPPGGKAIDRSDFPPEKTAYALRDVAFLQRQAAEQGVAIGRLAQALLDGPLPWTRMRQVYALLGLVRRFGAARVEAVCA